MGKKVLKSAGKIAKKVVSPVATVTKAVVDVVAPSVSKEIERTISKTTKQLERSESDIAIIAANPMLGLQALGAKEGVKAVIEAMTPDAPALPTEAEITAIEDTEVEKANEEAADRKKELQNRTRKYGRFSTIKTSPLGIAGLGGTRTALSTLLGR